jgi:hypothetical protein
MGEAGSNLPRQLLRRLERLLEEKLELTDSLARLRGDESEAYRTTLYTRLAELAEEQGRVLGELNSVLPPDHPPTDG